MQLVQLFQVREERNARESIVKSGQRATLKKRLGWLKSEREEDSLETGEQIRNGKNEEGEKVR